MSIGETHQDIQHPLQLAGRAVLRVETHQQIGCVAGRHMA